jgi:aspartyl/asparaginyl beta-hydroxylase (cupin superfamily)
VSKRIGLLLQDHEMERLQSLCANLGTTQSNILAAAVSCLTEAEVKDLIDRFHELQNIETELCQISNLETLKLLRSKTLPELRKILAAAKAVE